MAVDDRISFYGIGIEAPNPQTSLYGIGIESNPNRQTSLFGIGIEADNVFNANIVVKDGTTNLPVAGATVTTTTTQTVPGNYIGNLSVTSDSDGIANLRGSTTTGTLIGIEKTGYQTNSSDVPINMKTGNINIAIFPEGGGGSTSKKIYITNKGNVLINPNDTILIELN